MKFSKRVENLPAYVFAGMAKRIAELRASGIEVINFGMGDPDEQPGFDTTVKWDFLPKVIEVAVKRLPALADAAVSHAWAGLYEMTPDHNPIIGPAREVAGFYTVAGFSGHGFQHSPAAGRILADLITGRDPGLDITSFAHDRFGVPRALGELNVV